MLNLLGILFGIFIIVVSVMDADWFFERPRAMLTAKIFGGRQGARVVYGGTGVFIILMGLLIKSPS